MVLAGRWGAVSKDTTARIIQYLTSKEPYQIPLEEYLKTTWLHTSENNNWEIKKFATKLKQIVSILTGVKVEDLEKEYIKNSVLGKEWNYCRYDGQIRSESEFINLCSKNKDIIEEGVENYIQKRTYRSLLQYLGTNLLRKELHPDLFINALFADYKVLYRNNPWYDNRDVFSVSELDELIHPPLPPNWIISDMRFKNEYQAVKNKDGICIRIDRNQSTSTHQSEMDLDDYTFDWTIDNTKDIPWLVDQVKLMLKCYKIEYHK